MLGEYSTLAVDHRTRRARECVGDEKDLWVLCLRISIVKQAADDFRAALRAHDDCAVQTLCNWFRSEWGQLLSFGQGEAIIRRIKKEEEEREQNET